MGHHFMAVCVVCLLCAEHLPCKQHFENSGVSRQELSSSNEEGHTKPNVLQPHPGDIHLPNAELYDHNINQNYLPNNKRRGRMKISAGANRDSNEYLLERNILRTKRHLATDIDEKENSQQSENKPRKGTINNSAFIHKIYKQFGMKDHELKMNTSGFESMLKMLGLHSLIDDYNGGGLLKLDNIHHSSNNMCMSTMELIARLSGNENQMNAYRKLASSNLNNTTSMMNNSNAEISNGKFLVTNKTLAINSIKQHLFINSHDLSILCPILLYKLTAPTSNERDDCLHSNLLMVDDDDHHRHNGDNFEIMVEDRTLVWVYASLSILGISLCGLLGVVVIPFMEKNYYQHILQFFVALAVGTLTGDALLHLLPHAMLTYHAEDDPHFNMTLKGLVSTLAVIFFFITERGLTMIAEWRKRIEKKEKPSSRVRVMRNPDTSGMQNAGSSGGSGGEKQCKHKYSSYPYCYDEIAMATKDDHHQHNKENGIKQRNSITPQVTQLTIGNNHRMYKDNITTRNDYLDMAQQNLLNQNNSYITIGDGYVFPTSLQNSGGYDGVISNKDSDTTPGQDNTISTNLDDASIDDDGNGVGAIGDNIENTGAKIPEENYTVILREHEANHHGHSHTHGHVHSPPSTLSAVAWMVIMGDGLHNFTDGMAIGAAFSNNIAGGFSTAIAVFCHELPHEIGDFAVLLKAGMSARQAVYYNLLSSVLSFLGTALGIMIGETPEASAWIFACAAGMFIYIALVDMMPELTSSHQNSFAVSQLFLQALGMIVGVVIMLLIAVYEDDLKIIFTSTKSPQHNQHQHYHH